MRSFLASLITTVLLCGIALAEGPPKHAKKEPEPDPPGLKEPDQREHILRMAKQLGVAPELIEKARLAGVGIGEIDVLMDMARLAKKEPDEVIALRKKGTPWVKIAEGYGLKLEDVVKDEDARTSLIQGETNLVTELATRHGISEEQVLAYRAQLAEWGEVRLALGMSKLSSAPVQSIIDRFLAGEGWGTIGKDLGVHIGQLMRDPKSTENFGGPPTPHDPALLEKKKAAEAAAAAKAAEKPEGSPEPKKN